MDKCFYCKGIMEDDFTSYMADLDGHYVIIKNVPCHRCNQCGGVTFSMKTVTRIEQIVDNVKNALTEIAIIEYVA